MVITIYFKSFDSVPRSSSATVFDSLISHFLNSSILLIEMISNAASNCNETCVRARSSVPRVHETVLLRYPICVVIVVMKVF